MSNFNYTPPGTLAPFFASDKRVRFVRGPIGSTKSTAMVMELFRRAAEQAPDDQGIRRTRFAIVRNTLQQIRETCLETIYKCLRPVVKYKVSDQKVIIKVGDIHTEWLLLPLDTPENIQKLLSLELTGAWISEAREIEPEIAMNVLSRCGRFPSALAGGCEPSWYGMVMETNSFSEDSPWFNQVEVELPDNWDYIVQPGAFDPEADWKQYLPKTYYDDLITANTDDWVKQYIHNLISESLSGQAVYRNTFDTDYHVAKTPISPIPGRTLVVGMDFARYPAAIITQLDQAGRMRCLKELSLENSGIEKFMTEEVTPELMLPQYAQCPVVIVGDPSGGSRGEVGEEHVYDVLKRLGYVAMPAVTNNIPPRIRAVETWLMRQAQGQTSFVIDPVGCPMLIAGFKTHYRYKKRRTGDLEDKPDKTKRPWADLHDALQYAALGSGTRMQGRIVNRLNRQTAKDTMPVGAWT
jgi:hypothetical protein